jgi:integrase/recombinase XerD
MLQQLFVRVHFRYTQSRHADDLTAFARWLLEQGYRERYAQRLVFRAMRSLETFGLPPASTWTKDSLERAFRRIRQRRLYRHAQHAFGAFLRSVGRLRSDNAPKSAHAPLIAAYRSYLVDVRGLAPGTVTQHLWEVGAFLRETLTEGQPLTQLTAATIERYIERRARRVMRRTLRTTITELQAFLRYCFERRLILARLDLIDRPVSFRYELPPRALDWDLIQHFLSSIDRSGPTGWRDYMLLYLMAHYGLRPGEIARLTLDSIDWCARTLLVEQSKTHTSLTLPLLRETATLLRRYVREGRRESRHRELFLSASAPDRPMTKFSVCLVFKVRARKSSLPIAHASAYALRHSFAMRLFSRGVGIKAIGDLMGHSSLVSTAVYLRLQTDALRDVALEVPSVHQASGGVA